MRESRLPLEGMCGRFTQAYTWQEVHEFYQLTGPARNLQRNYNVAPTQTVNVIVAGNAGFGLQDMRWGLIPPWTWDLALKDEISIAGIDPFVPPLLDDD